MPAIHFTSDLDHSPAKEGVWSFYEETEVNFNPLLMVLVKLGIEHDSVCVHIQQLF